MDDLAGNRRRDTVIFQLLIQIVQCKLGILDRELALLQVVAGIAVVIQP